jgi:tRNA dimethylallyltransferase
MVARGLVDETRGLLAAGVAADAPGMRTVGYKEAIEHLAGGIDEVAMTAFIQQSTRRYAKRQMTWFRRVEGVEWLDPRTADVAAIAGRINHEDAEGTKGSL